MFDRVRGVNLSGWFILEPWVTPSLFAATGASNDGELQQVLGPAAYNERVREHYETFATSSTLRECRRWAQRRAHSASLVCVWRAKRA